MDGELEPIQQIIGPGQGQDLQADALQRINGWLDRLEDQARRLLEAFQPDELEPVQAANVASKYITLIARLLELRQQFTNESSSDEERLLKIIFATSHKEASI